MLDGSSIDIFSMPYFIDRNGACSVVYLVDDAIVSLTYAISVIETGKFLRPIGARIIG